MRHLRIFTLLLALLSFTAIEISAQPGGGGGGMGGGMGGPGGGGGMGGGGDLVNVDPVATMGLFEIDGNNVVKKIKVKDPEIQTAVRRVIADYIIEYGNVVSTNGEAIEQLEVIKEKILDMQIQGDMSSMRQTMQSMNELGKDIRPAMIQAHKTLNDSMQEVLKGHEKEFGKWKSYYESICAENLFNPNRPERGERGEGGRGQGGQGGQGGQRPMRE